MKIPSPKTLLTCGTISLIALGTGGCPPPNRPGLDYVDHLVEESPSETPSQLPSEPGQPPAPPETLVVIEDINLAFSIVPGGSLGLPPGIDAIVLDWDSVRQLQEFALFKLEPGDTEFEKFVNVSASSGSSGGGQYSVMLVESTTGPYRYFVASVDAFEEEVGGVIKIIFERSNEVEVDLASVPPGGGSPLPPDPDPGILAQSKLLTSDSSRSTKKSKRSEFGEFSSLSRLRGDVRFGSTKSKVRFPSVPIKTSRSGLSASVNLNAGAGGGLQLEMKSNGKAEGNVELAVLGTVVKIPVEGSHQRKGRGVFATFSGELLGETTNGRVKITPSRSGVRLKAIFLANGRSISFDVKAKSQKP